MHVVSGHELVTAACLTIYREIASGLKLLRGEGIVQ